MSKENDHKKIEFLEQALEEVVILPSKTRMWKLFAKSKLRRYKDMCLELDAEELNLNKLSKQLSMEWPGKLVEDHEE